MGTIPRMARGQQLTAEKLNTIIDAVNAAQIAFIGGAGINMRRTPGGVMLHAVGTGDNACLAQITNTDVPKATSSTRPGNGTLQRFTSLDKTTSPWTLGDLTTIDEDCVNILTDKKVANGSTVGAVKILGVWTIVIVDACADLLS